MEDTTFQLDRTRLYPSEIQSVLVGTTSTPIMGSAPNRRAVVFTSDGTNTVTLSNTSPVVAGIGLTIPNTFGTLELRREQYGSIITRPWFAIGNAVGARVNFVEVLDSPDDPDYSLYSPPTGRPGYYSPEGGQSFQPSSVAGPPSFPTGPPPDLNPTSLEDIDRGR